MSRRGGAPETTPSRRAAAHTKDRLMPHWEPYVPRGPRLRVYATSCCCEYELVSESGQYFVLRWTGDGEQQEETGRGVYARTAAIWRHLTSRHRCRKEQETATHLAHATHQKGDLT
ncbi:hypothetical protein FE391_29575 [Nonomuraea sp. KC401]|uniref:hypothetical protein n=1 Tax=unclassified Nonomuraea TaxID=2593643 RepID=UPI0010FDC9E2|nr:MULTISPECIES: hypothetical protein [unclassified Nonomuraea]NBE97469.1 hypothetical protein [Nonomuraea sp. K271]TLF62722.1 hypothetical protein FE391_29575 [Nonomuraea sp. KC401]